MSEDFSLMQEIDDALRADKAQKFWQTYGKTVLGGCAVIVALTAASAFWKNHLNEENMEQTHLMLQAKIAAAAGRFHESQSSLKADSDMWPADRANFVKLQAADIDLRAKDRDHAIALLKQIVASNTGDQAIRDSAAMRLYALTGEGDAASANQPGRPFSGIVMQMEAASLLKAGKNKEAAAVLKQLTASSPVYSTEHESAVEMLPLTGESAE